MLRGSIELGKQFAEYKALIVGLKTAMENGAKEILAYGDSMLVCKHMREEWRIRAQNLLPLFREAKSLVARLNRFDIKHIPRKGNARADELANRALDERAAADNTA